MFQKLCLGALAIWFFVIAFGSLLFFGGWLFLLAILIAS
jgi:hypothetical protein